MQAAAALLLHAALGRALLPVAPSAMVVLVQLPTPPGYWGNAVHMLPVSVSREEVEAAGRQAGTAALQAEGASLQQVKAGALRGVVHGASPFGGDHPHQEDAATTDAAVRALRQLAGSIRRATAAFKAHPVSPLSRMGWLLDEEDCGGVGVGGLQELVDRDDSEGHAWAGPGTEQGGRPRRRSSRTLPSSVCPTSALPPLHPPDPLFPACAAHPFSPGQPIYPSCHTLTSVFLPGCHVGLPAGMQGEALRALQDTQALVSAPAHRMLSFLAAHRMPRLTCTTNYVPGQQVRLGR